MATIEERAYQYVTKKVGRWYTGGSEGGIWKASYDAYIEIATEQRKIDIEKVYHALENVLSKEILENIKKLMEDDEVEKQKEYGNNSIRCN